MLRKQKDAGVEEMLWQASKHVGGSRRALGLWWVCRSWAGVLQTAVPPQPYPISHSHSAPAATRLPCHPPTTPAHLFMIIAPLPLSARPHSPTSPACTLHCCFSSYFACYWYILCHLPQPGLFLALCAMPASCLPLLFSAPAFPQCLWLSSLLVVLRTTINMPPALACLIDIVSCAASATLAPASSSFLCGIILKLSACSCL
ncbi:hypothetical protein NPIL_486621 [Nephila pilipes]|uniref:Uncharacterized protein n=1 Tax=Nephila pilipes TaxID=299642 RepID=A0A8X6R8C9_NEPPI|nr:hypothetical protein NPIL_486621 [Nephila pilipes]